jgi:hypothetical protein
VLEIGGGPGVTASLVCARLDRGRLLLIDRSATAIERTLRRNPEHAASRRLALETVDLAAFDPGRGAMRQGLRRQRQRLLDDPCDRGAGVHPQGTRSRRAALPFLRDAERGAGSTRRRTGGRRAAGERVRRTAAHLPLRDPRRMCRATSLTDAHAWNIYGAERSQPVATGGNCGNVENGPKRRKPLP